MIVSELWRYPVKSMQGERRSEITLEADGIAFDRAFGLQEVATGRVLSAKSEGLLLLAEGSVDEAGVPVIRLPHTELRGRSSTTDTALSAWLGRDVRLVAARESEPAWAENISDVADDDSPLRAFELPAGRFVDSSDLLLITTATLRAAGMLHPDGEWDVRRFRPNILLDVPGTDWVEDAWIGRTLRLGEVEIEVHKACRRCVMVTRRQPGLERDLEIFRSLVDTHGGALGVRCSVRVPGRLSIGCEVELDANSPAA